MTPKLDGYTPIPLGEATALLAAESGLDGDLSEIARMLGCEPPVLRWAGSLAKTMGWGPLQKRLVGWSSPARVPWRAEVEHVIESVTPADAELLATLAACDASFGWEVLEAVAPDVSIDAICRLEESQLLTRVTRAGIVTFSVPYAVRAVYRERGLPDGGSKRWLEAWNHRATELRRTSYGPDSRSVLTELAAVVPLAARALFQADSARAGLALWAAASDAIFFADAIAFDAPAFAHAVVVADRAGDVELRVRARVVAARAALERGDPNAASTLAGEANSLADRDELRIDALRGMGWAALALTNLDGASAAFQKARERSEGEPRAQADATAGLGIIALMSGDPATAQTLLAEALAIHVVTRDEPREASVRGMMELLPEGRGGGTDLAREVEDLRAKGQRWREALALARLALEARARGDIDAERARLFEARAAATLSNMPASALVRSLVETSEQTKPIVVATDGRALTLPSGESHDLGRHGPARRVLWTLALSRRDRPGTPLSTMDLIEAGWPGEKMRHDAATLRVYTTIRRLRALGLGDALVTRDDGYLLDPNVAVTIG